MINEWLSVGVYLISRTEIENLAIITAGYADRERPMRNHPMINVAAALLAVTTMDDCTFTRAMAHFPLINLH